METFKLILGIVVSAGLIAIGVVAYVQFGLTGLVLYLVLLALIVAEEMGRTIIERRTLTKEQHGMVCRKCGYDLRGNPEGQICPECGSKVSHAQK